MDHLNDFKCRVNLAIKQESLSVEVNKSKFIIDVLDLLEREGYIRSYQIKENKIEVFFRYYKGYCSFFKLESVSKRSKRIFLKKTQKLFDFHRSVYIVSNSGGLALAGRQYKLSQTGEILFKIEV